MTQFAGESSLLCQPLGRRCGSSVPSIAALRAREVHAHSHGYEATCTREGHPVDSVRAEADEPDLGKDIEPAVEVAAGASPSSAAREA
jgi:hypothetical protein